MSAVNPAFSSSSRSIRSRNERKRSAAMPPDFFMDAPQKRSADNIGGLRGPQPWQHRYCLACSGPLLWRPRGTNKRALLSLDKPDEANDQAKRRAAAGAIFRLGSAGRVWG